MQTLPFVIFQLVVFVSPIRILNGSIWQLGGATPAGDINRLEMTTLLLDAYRKQFPSFPLKRVFWLVLHSSNADCSASLRLAPPCDTKIRPHGCIAMAFGSVNLP